MKADALLVAEGVRKAFGGVTAVDIERFSVNEGEIVALIGPNGAGKTTFFNVLTGFERADMGTWSFAGRPLAGKPAFRVARAGMVRTFQIPKALARLSVLENMMLAAPAQPGERALAAMLRPVWRSRERAVTSRAREILAWIGLDSMERDFAGTLSGGQRKLLELARALMTEPRLLMLDEPMAGVNPVLAEQLLLRLRELRDGGMTLLFVEHDMDVVARIASVVVCMAEGRVIARGTAAEVASTSAVIDAYLGSRHDRLGGPP